MKTQREELAEHILKLVRERAKRIGCRVKKLSDSGAWEAAINGAAWRLFQLDGVDWYTNSAERNKLIDRNLDSDAQEQLRATKASGGTPAGELTNPATLEELERYVDGGIPIAPGLQLLPANSVTDEIEREEYEAENADTEEVRKKIEEGENKKLQEALDAYSETLKTRRQQKALALMRAEPKLTNSTIAARVSMQSAKNIKPDTVSKIRDHVESLEAKFELNTLVREIAAVKTDVAALKAERRRDEFLRNHSVEEFEAFRAWSAPLYGAMGLTLDEMLAPTLNNPKPSI
jgi:hypothetical protein